MRRGYDPMGPGWGGHGWDGGWFLWGRALGIVLFLAVLALIVWLVIRAVGGTRTDDPLRRAAARYAAGKIERVEFERIQRDLQAVGQAVPPSPATPPAPPEDTQDA